ncbi:hypothetical protein BD779DRAFT_1481133 [Infundibulicybe gibba]|nr:hypothetical protein BD779DRAFT_1481133 [Infundibulicybe gibba]
MSQTPSKATTHDPQRLTKRIGPTPLRQTEPNAGEMASRTSVAPLAPPDTQPPPTAARGTVFEPHKPLATHSVAVGAPPQTTIFAHEPVQTAAMAGKIPSQTEQRARDASYHATVALVSPQSSPDPIKGSTSWADEVELALPSIGVTPQPTPSARDFSALRSSKPDPFRALRRRTRRRRRQACPLTSTLSSRNLGPTTPGTQNRTRDVEPISRPPGLRPTSPGMRDFSASHASNPNLTGAPRRHTRRRRTRHTRLRLDGKPVPPGLNPDLAAPATRDRLESVEATVQPPRLQLPARGARDWPASRSSNPSPTDRVLEQCTQRRWARRPRSRARAGQETPPATPTRPRHFPTGPIVASRHSVSITHEKPVPATGRIRARMPILSHSTPTPTGLDWESDPRLAELSRALRALGWIRPPNISFALFRDLVVTSTGEATGTSPSWKGADGAGRASAQLQRRRHPCRQVTTGSMPALGADPDPPISNPIKSQHCPPPARPPGVGFSRSQRIFARRNALESVYNALKNALIFEQFRGEVARIEQF